MIEPSLHREGFFNTKTQVYAPSKERNKKGGNKMNANVAIQVLPHVSTDEEVVRIVDEVIDYIKSTGVTYYVGPCETALEGEYETLMEIVKNCQYIAIKAGCPKVASYVKITFAPEGGVLTIDQKVTKHHQ
jgi:uncharacterized protein YqgV (UPF0045/DUF77 family)